MGKVEKIIVLSVLSLVTIILVVSLNGSRDSGEVDSALEQGLESAQRRPESESAVPSVEGPSADNSLRELSEDELTRLLAEGAREVEPIEAASPLPSDPVHLDPGSLATGPKPAAQDPRIEPGRLLSSTVAVEEPRPAAREAVPEGSTLITVRGLEDSYLDEFKLYTWRPGDDLETVAARYYGNSERAEVLQRFNEGEQHLRPGDRILVPVFDLTGEGALERAGEVGAYVVRQGDSLWTISKEVYGKGSEWRSIYEANRDVMADEHSLHVGMRLRVP